MRVHVQDRSCFEIGRLRTRLPVAANGVAERRREGRRARLADAGQQRRALDQMHIDLARGRRAGDQVIVEVALLNRPSLAVISPKRADSCRRCWRPPSAPSPGRD